MADKYGVRLKCKQGEDWQRRIRHRVDGVPVNNTGFTGRMVIAQDGNPPVTVTITQVNTAQGKITFNGADGTFTLLLRKVVTELFVESSYAFDLFINDGSIDGCLFSGVIEISPSAG